MTTTPGVLGTGIDSLVVAGQYLFLTAGQGGKELWVSNGINTGTQKLTSFTKPAHEITNLVSPSPAQPKADKAYFTAGTGSNLYFTDGSSVSKVKGIVLAHSLASSKRAIYFTSGTNLFKTSSIIAELVAGSSYHFFYLTDAHNRLFFAHDNPGIGFELYWLESSGGFPPFRSVRLGKARCACLENNNGELARVRHRGNATQRMNNAGIKQQISSKIQEFRALLPSVDNGIVRQQYHLIKELVNNLSGSTADEKELYLQAANVVNLFSQEDEGYFVKANGSDVSQKTAALRRLQEWAKRAGDLLQG